MDLVVIGMNHKTAPVEIREKFSFSPKMVVKANRLLKESIFLAENLILSTCNRVEIYALAEHNKDYENNIKTFLMRFHNRNLLDYEDTLYIHKDKSAVEHLFGVAAGIDSMILGEMEILNQVKKAYQDARETLTTGKVLNRLFEKAFNTAKKIRTETFICRGVVSVSSAAVRLAKKILGELRNKTALIIGTGTLGEQLLSYLRQDGIKSIVVSSRGLEKAQNLARRFSASAVPFEDFRAGLVEADIVISSTRAPHSIITKDDIVSLMSQRRDRPLFIIDLAVPRDVKPEVNTVDNVYLYNIDYLEKIVDGNIKVRRSELESCSNIIDVAAERFMAWLVNEKIKDEN